MAQVNLSAKQKQTHRQRTVLWLWGGKGEGRTGTLGLEMQTIIYRMDKQQGPTV